MAKLESTFKNMFISLSLICLTVAILLAQVNKMTAKPIAEAQAMKLQGAISEVIPEFDNDPVVEAFTIAAGEGDSLLVYPAKRGDKIVGFAMNSYSNNGFSGNIQLMVGFDMEHRLVNYSVLQHAETPGLGSKMSEWFRDKERPTRSVIGRDLSARDLAVTNDGGDVDAITASTITSRAFLEAVNRAYVAYKESLNEIQVSSDETINRSAVGESLTEQEGGNSNE